MLEFCRHYNACTYVTGHGASNYINHELFEAEEIEIRYMDYNLTEYPQQHGEFNPYVSALDLVANCGKSGRSHINSTSVSWQKFLEAN